MTEAMRPYLDKLQSRAMVVGVVGALLTVAGFFINSEQFFRSYLMAFMQWGGVAFGSLGLLMLHHMVGGNWGVAIRRQLEAGTRTLPFMVILFLPIAFGVHTLYEWSHADVVAKDSVLQHKSLYLNVSFFYFRAAFYFAMLIFLATRLNAITKRQESEGYWAVRPALQRVSAPGLIVFVMIVTFASIDWVMSIEPHWHSTIIGAIIIAGEVLNTFGVMTFVLCYLTTKEPMKGVVSTQTYHDLGSLMFAFNMFWAYVAFSQLLIIWSANLPEETQWYLKRFHNGWEYIGVAVFLFHFCVTFILLLSRSIKRNPHILRKVAAWVVLMRLLDLIWVIQPAFSHAKENGVPVSYFDPQWLWLYIAAPMALGGIWMTLFAMQLKKRSLEPLKLQ